MKLIDMLIQRGDSITLVDGKLNILPASGSPVPEQWLKDNKHLLMLQINENEEALQKPPKDQTVDEWIYGYCKDR